MAIVVTRCFCTLTPYSMMRSLLNLEVSLRRILNGLTQPSFWSNVPARFKMCLPVCPPPSGCLWQLPLKLSLVDEHFRIWPLPRLYNVTDHALHRCGRFWSKLLNDGTGQVTRFRLLGWHDCFAYVLLFYHWWQISARLISPNTCW